MQIMRLDKESQSEDADMAVMKVVKQRCADLKTNLVFIVVPSDEASILKKMGFLNPCKATEWVTDRHKDEI